ncbi:MAG: MarR family transcriptional regulator [Micromonosporaceae bacterium]|nr:MarR family transcriptional regulator [Micromonosporaceae bacterium]
MPGLALTTVGLLNQVARDIRTLLDQEFAPLGVTAQQAGVLLHVSAGETTPRRLAELLATDTAGMTRLLDRLERHGLVRREADPSDRRSIRVALTASGQALIPAIPPIFGTVADRVTAGISSADLRVMHDALLTMRANLGRPASG